jgi:hypothetical protein
MPVKKTSSKKTTVSKKKPASKKPAAKAAAKTPAKPAAKSPVKAAVKAVPRKKPAPARTATTLFSGDVTQYTDFTPYELKKGEEYMNEAQLQHFAGILRAWKRGLMEEVDRTVGHMKDEATNFPDPNDRATGRGVQPGTAHPRPRAQADQEDRRGAGKDRGSRLRLLRGLRHRDRRAAPRSAPDRDHVHRLQDPRRAERKTDPGLMVSHEDIKTRR